MCQRGGVAYIECAAPHKCPASKSYIVVIKRCTLLVTYTINAINGLDERLPVSLPGVASGLLWSTVF